MNLIKSQSNIVEKVLRDKDGKLIRARFFVYENGGRIKARLLDFVYLTEQALLNGTKLLLSASSKSLEKVFKLFRHFFYSIFIIRYSIFNLGSKPRAPTLI
jgi:hypothetical protein